MGQVQFLFRLACQSQILDPLVKTRQRQVIVVFISRGAVIKVFVNFVVNDQGGVRDKCFEQQLGGKIWTAELAQHDTVVDDEILIDQFPIRVIRPPVRRTR